MGPFVPPLDLRPGTTLREAVNDYLIIWQPSPITGRVLAFVYAPEGAQLALCGFLTFTEEQAREVHTFWPGSQQGWDDDSVS